MNSRCSGHNLTITGTNFGPDGQSLKVRTFRSPLRSRCSLWFKLSQVTIDGVDCRGAGTRPYPIMTIPHRSGWRLSSLWLLTACSRLQTSGVHLCWRIRREQGGGIVEARHAARQGHQQWLQLRQYARAPAFVLTSLNSMRTQLCAGSLIQQNTLRVWRQAPVSNLGVASISNVAPYSSILIAINGIDGLSAIVTS